LVAFRRAGFTLRHAEVKERAILRPGEESRQVFGDPELDGLVVDHAFLHESAEQNLATCVVLALAGIRLGFECGDARLFGADLSFGGFDALFERELFLLGGLQSSVSSWRDFAAPRMWYYWRNPPSIFGARVRAAERRLCLFRARDIGARGLRR
jgi:hypothetical protein